MADKGRYSSRSMVRFLHSADWQLGMARHYLSQEAQARFSAARIDVIEQIGNLAIQENCEFVVVCGDVFESNHVQRQVLLRAFEKMAATPDVAFFLLPGNHDPIDASTIYRSPTFMNSKPDNAKILEGSGPVQATAGVEMIPAAWPNKHPGVDLVAAACEGLEPTDAIRIVVGHGAIDSMSPDPDNPAHIALEGMEEKIESGLVQYVALGDRHSTTDVGGTGRVWYPGAPEPTDYTEVDPGNVLIVDLDADNVDVAVQKIGTWHFVRRDWEVSADADIDALDEWLSALDDKDRTVARVSIVGQVSVAQKARVDSVLDHNAELLAALEPWEQRSDLAVLLDEADLDNLGLSGFGHEALLDLQEMAESGEQTVAARNALALLYRLVGSPK